MKKNAGFTLVELMITLFIVGILVAVGVPSLKHFMQGSRLIATTNELLSAIHVTRSEAIKMNAPASICASSDGKECSGDTDWSNGWIVFVDVNGNGLQDAAGAPCTTTGEECLLRIHEAISDDQLSVSGIDVNSVALTSFTFSARGLPTINNVSQSGTYSLCTFDAGDNVLDSRAVVLSLSGRVRVSDNAAVISCPATP